MLWVKGNKKIDGSHLTWKDDQGNEFETWNPTEDFLIEQGWTKEEEISPEESKSTSLRELKESILQECNTYYSSIVLQVQFNQQFVWIPIELRTAYRYMLDDLKEAGETSVIWRDKELKIEDALSCLKKINLFEYECKKVYDNHIRNIIKLNNAEEIEAYDYTEGYPFTLVL
jgi:hypothetical protein